MNKPWLDNDNHEKAAGLYARGVLDQVEAELALQMITNEASFDAGFEYGVLAAEAGVGRADE